MTMPLPISGFSNEFSAVFGRHVVFEEAKDRFEVSVRLLNGIRAA